MGDDAACWVCGRAIGPGEPRRLVDVPATADYPSPYRSVPACVVCYEAAQPVPGRKYGRRFEMPLAPVEGAAPMLS